MLIKSKRKLLKIIDRPEFKGTVLFNGDLYLRVVETGKARIFTGYYVIIGYEMVDECDQLMVKSVDLSTFPPTVCTNIIGFDDVVKNRWRSLSGTISVTKINTP